MTCRDFVIEGGAHDDPFHFLFGSGHPQMGVFSPIMIFLPRSCTPFYILPPMTGAGLTMDMLETVIPKHKDALVMVVRGEHKGQVGHAVNGLLHSPEARQAL